MNQYNREVIDGMHSTGSYFLDRKLDLPLNSFKTKANGFCKRSSKNFSLQENRMTVKLSIWWIQSNSITFKASAFAKLDVSNSRHECIHATVVILPIEKYKLLKFSAHWHVVDCKFFVHVSRCKRREWSSNCRWEQFNQIESSGWVPL